MIGSVTVREYRTPHGMMTIELEEKDEIIDGSNFKIPQHYSMRRLVGKVIKHDKNWFPVPGDEFTISGYWNGMLLVTMSKPHRVDVRSQGAFHLHPLKELADLCRECKDA